MLSTSPYLMFAGNAEEAFNFYKSVFSGEISELQRFKDTPDEGKVSENEKNQLAHVALSIKDKTILMGSDAPGSYGHQLVKGNNNYISINADNKEDVDKIFKGLSAEGQVEMPLQNTFWGAYFGMVADKFGVHWMVSTDNK